MDYSVKLNLKRGKKTQSVLMSPWASPAPGMFSVSVTGFLFVKHPQQNHAKNMDSFILSLFLENPTPGIFWGMEHPSKASLNPRLPLCPSEKTLNTLKS